MVLELRLVLGHGLLLGWKFCSASMNMCREIHGSDLVWDGHVRFKFVFAIYCFAGTRGYQFLWLSGTCVSFMLGGLDVDLVQCCPLVFSSVSLASEPISSMRLALQHANLVLHRRKATPMGPTL